MALCTAITRPLFSLALFLVFAHSASADVYKWVDKDGKVQYSDQPPLSGEAKKMKKKTKDTGNVAPVTGAAKPGASTADQELEFRKRKIEQAEAEKKTQAEKELNEKNKSYCKNLRGELQAHKDGVRIVQYNANGERIALDDGERVQSQARLAERLAKECK